MGHPLQLPLAMAIAQNKPAETECHLIISRHKYWKYVDLEEFTRYFASVRFFEPIYYAHSVRQLIQTLKRMSAAKKLMATLPVGKDDVIVSLEVWNYIENLFTTIYSANKQIFLCPEGIYPFVSLKPAQIRAKKNFIGKSGWIHHVVIEPVMGLKKRTFVYWPHDKEKRRFWGICYSRKIEDLYDSVFVLKSLFAITLKENEIYYPYPILRQGSSAPGKKIILFMLSGFVTDNMYNESLSIALQHLRKLYEKEYELHIRLHPNQPKGDKYVNVQGWMVNRELGNVEQFLIRHGKRITAIFSDKSTGQIFALNLGIPCYSYHRLLGIDKNIVKWHDQIYENAPQEFFMKALNQVPKNYEFIKNGQEKAKLSLDRLFQTIYA